MNALVLVSLTALAAAALCGALHRSRLAAAAGLLGLGALGVLGALGLSGGHLAGALPLGLPPLDLSWRLTPLSGLFLLLLAVVGAASTLYAPTYLAHAEPRKARTAAAVLPAFLASMALVLLAAGAVAFLLAWECMSLTSYALVMTDGERDEVVRSGFVYLVMTHAGGLCLLAAFLLLGRASGSLDFAVWATAAPHLAPALRSLVFVLLLAGFGGKAALVPLHVWLPRAHPVAPSHVSALMSGVMLKIAVYGLVLFAFQLLGPGPLWWGAAVLLAGLASTVLGVLYAAAERDLKRLLAHSSVENVGIIAIGLGVALLARSQGADPVAALAIVAALLYAASHALYKTALFLGAGSLQHAGAGRDLDAMGGLFRRLPWTCAALLGAGPALAGLPPFSGFIGEWLTYQSLLRLARAGSGATTLLCFAGVLGLALAGGLAAGALVKALGVGLLGRPRSAGAAGAEEVPAGMRLPPLLLLAAGLLLGLAPGAPAALLARLAAGVLGTAPAAAASSAVLLSLPWSGARLLPAAPALLVLAGALAAGLALALTRRGRPAPEARAPWGCGGELPAASQYSATVYAKPFRQVFGTVYRPVRALEVRSAVHPFFRTQVAYQGEITLVFERFLYRPAVAGLVALAAWSRRLQSGSLRLYLGYMLAALVLLLAFAR